MAMKFALTIGGLCLATLSAATAQGQPAANMSPSARLKVYALVAAIGDEFSIVSENMNVFSHIEHIHFSRRSRTAPDDLLNRLALASLDKAVARLEPDSKRIYLQFGMPRVDGIAASKREDAVLAIIQSQLRDIPERRQWDRILVATPAYRLFDHEGLAVSSGNMTRLQGFGVFTQPATGGESESFGGKPFRQHAISPDRKEVKSETFIAPFSYVEIWVLDARTSRSSTNRLASIIKNWPTPCPVQWTSIKAFRVNSWPGMCAASSRARSRKR